jgi:hypothetical protein
MNRLALFAGLVAAACSSNPVDVTGDYSVQITNGSNGCMFANYTVGNSTMDIPVTVTQNGAAATATVTGTAGDYLNLVLGSNAFVGTVDGSSLALTLTGNRAESSGDCAFTYNATLDADLADNSLSGTIDYTSDTNNGSDCAAITGCVTTQDFAGSRPPP